MQHHRTVSGFKKVGGKPAFFSYVEKVQPTEQEAKKPFVIDFVPKNEDASDEKKAEFVKEISSTSTCGCF